MNTSPQQPGQARWTQSHTYPEFNIDGVSGRIWVNLIEASSGRILRHIPPTELHQIMQNYHRVSTQ